MNAPRAVIALLAAALAAAPAGVLADKGGKGKDPMQGPPGQSAGKGKGHPQGPPGQAPGNGKQGKAAKGGRPDSEGVAVLIGGDERRVIHDYFRINPYPAQGLPPGIAKNLARGKPLPPGIAKRYLPPGLIGQLPPRPGYEWVAVGRDVALIAIATGIVVDILSDVF